MKARGRRPSAFIVSKFLESLMKHEARVFDTTFQVKQYRFIQCHIFVICIFFCILPFGITACARPKRFGLGSPKRLWKKKI